MAAQRIGVTAIRCNSISRQPASRLLRLSPIRSSDLTQAAHAPGQTAARATDTADTANDGAAAEPTASATGATSATATTMAAAAAMTAAATVAATASTGKLHTAATANVFPIEEIERGEADVGHFLFAKNEAMIGQAIVGLRDIGGRHRGCRCAADQRKTQSGGTQHTDGGGFACAPWRRSWLVPWHGRILQQFT